MLSDLRLYFGSGGSTLTHMRRCAIRTADGNFVEADFTTPATGTSSVTHILTTPTWTDGGTRRMAFATPTDVPDLRALYFAGADFNSIGGFDKQNYTVTIAGTEYNLWTNDGVLPSASGAAVQIEP